MVLAGVGSSSSSNSATTRTVSPEYELVMLDKARGHWRPKVPMPLTQDLLNSTRDHRPELICNPAPVEGPKSYLPFAMAASMEATHGGRLWTCWAGGGESGRAAVPPCYIVCYCATSCWQQHACCI